MSDHGLMTIFHKLLLTQQESFMEVQSQKQTVENLSDNKMLMDSSLEVLRSSQDSQILSRPLALHNERFI